MRYFGYVFCRCVFTARRRSNALSDMNFKRKGHQTVFIKKKSFLILSLLFICLGLEGCETMEGAGRDIEHAGEAVQDAAD